MHVHAQTGAIEPPFHREGVWRTRELVSPIEVVSGDDGYLELGGEDSAVILTPQPRSLVALHKLCTHTHTHTHTARVMKDIVNVHIHMRSRGSESARVHDSMSTSALA